MSQYEGEFADLYDLFYADKDYEDEVEFTDGLLRAQAQGPSARLLDVACGTGQHAVRFATRGWDVVGLDISADMLSRARSRPGGEAVEFVQQDMRRLEVPFKEFDAAVCLFDSIGYAVTNEGIVETLSRVRRHLRSGGLFVAEFWHAPPMLRDYEPVRVRQWETPNGSVVRISRTTLDIAAQLARVEFSVLQLRKDGTYSSWIEAHENRYFLIQEMGLFLHESGFEPLRWLAGFDGEAPIDEHTWHVLVLARASQKDA